MLASRSGSLAARSRRPPVLLALVVAAMLALASGASAAMTQSAITSPADPFFGFDQGQVQNVTISGTSDGVLGDKVDILCYNDDGSAGASRGVVAPEVDVNEDGSFSTSVPLSALSKNALKGSGLCRLRAVPAETSPTTGLSAFAGPRTAVGYLDLNSSDSYLRDYYVDEPQLSAADDYDSYASCGLADSYLLDPTILGQLDGAGFYCNDWADNPTESDSTRSAVEVDGFPAYAASEAWNINPGASGLPLLTVDSITQDPTNGDLVITETDQLARCSGDAFPANSVNCTAFVPSGVQVQRTITQNNAGNTVYIKDEYSSTDSAQHAVSLLMENDQIFEAGSTFGDGDVSYEFPGQSSFAPATAGETVSAPATVPASILVKNNVEPDGSTSGGVGAITYYQTPSAPFTFSNNDDPDAVFDAANTVSVPASGTASIEYAYSSDYTLAAVQHDALVAEDAGASAPAVSISSPAGGATVSSTPVTVTGSASAGSGVQSVTVNGVSATVSGGSFSASVPLTQGANTLTATLTSDAAGTATASTTVNYTPATTPPVVNSCPSASGQLSGDTLGRLTLEMTRAQADRVMPMYTSMPYGFENHCLANGSGIRVAFGSPRLLASIAQASRATFGGRIVLALTAKSYYSVDRVRPGMSLATAERDLKLGQPIHVGLNDWYIATATHSNTVLKVRDGIVEEIGIAAKALTNTRASQRHFLTHT